MALDFLLHDFQLFIIFTNNFALLLILTLVLLLEPDNKTCSEFHAVIVEKMQQGLYI